MRLVLRINCIILFALLLACSGTEERILSKVDAMAKFKELSPREGAEFYLENRSRYAFMDSLYRDSVMPAISQCNFFDLDSVRDVLSETNFVAIIEPLYQKRRKEVVSLVKLELEKNALKQIEIYDKHYLPSLEMSIDSMLDDDVERIMSKYAGGFLNYRKLAFLFGRGRKDFKEMFWEKFDTLRYQGKMNEYINSFFISVKGQQDAYCMDLTGLEFKDTMKVETPSLIIGLSQSTLSHVSKYTSQQSSEIIGEAVKDYAVPLLLGAVSGGVANLYDVGSTAYDINKIVNEVKNAKIDDDEMVKFICSHDLAYQIKNYYIGKWTSQVHNEINRSNEKLYRFILKNL